MGNQVRARKMILKKERKQLQDFGWVGICISRKIVRVVFLTSVSVETTWSLEIVRALASLGGAKRDKREMVDVGSDTEMGLNWWGLKKEGLVVEEVERGESLVVNEDLMAISIAIFWAQRCRESKGSVFYLGSWKNVWLKDGYIWWRIVWWEIDGWKVRIFGQ
jgi:hypothetical protein